MHYQGYGKSPEVCNKGLPKAVGLLYQLFGTFETSRPTNAGSEKGIGQSAPLIQNSVYYEEIPKKRQLTYNTRHVNNLSLTPVSYRTSVHSNSLFPRTIELWNRIMANCELIISTCTPLKLFT